MFSVKSIKSLGEKFLHFKTTSTCALDHLRPDVAHLRLRVREEGGGQRGQVRAPGPGRGAALDPQGLRVTLYAPSPTISLCRHAEQGCGVEAKKSPVAAKKPAYKRAAIVDETRDKSTGGDCGTWRWRRLSSRSGSRARPWPWWTLHNTQHSSQILLLLFLLHFYYRGYETRIQGDLYIYRVPRPAQPWRTSSQSL